MSSSRANEAPFPQKVDSGSRDRSIDGIPLREVASPRSLDEVADALRSAHDEGRVVVPWGGGTLMGLGNVPECADLAVDLTALNQVVSYEPDDLTIAVQAGCRVAELESLLSENGQILPFDAAEPELATIGGLYASGISGPRRFGYGAMRDLVIGITVMSPRGELARGGGMVVKNVSGYDMMRLHYGALGSLGVILQLNFKVIPAPRGSRTAVLRFSDAASAIDAAMRVRESPLAPTSIVALDDGAAIAAGLHGAPMTLLLRADGPEGSVQRQVERLAEMASGGAARVVEHEDEETLRLWKAVNQALSARSDGSSIRARIGVAPSEAVDVMSRLSAISDQGALGQTVMADLGSGQIFVRITSSTSESDALSTAWSAMSTLGRHRTLIAAPPDVKIGIDVFGSEPAGFAVMRALKEQFDPSHTLNRGRFIGRL